tara:strand:+ start:1917 stop:2897 length:981 start_codon:yes stop_codon:yes gene_type:complete
MALDLKIGVGAWLGPSSPSAATISRQAVKAESFGFHSFWLPESHFGTESSIPAPLLLLAAAAAQTTRLVLGTGSYLLPIRNPIEVAEEVAVLDHLSEGRVILGVGRGYQKKTYSAFKASLGKKRQVFEDALDVMLRAWTGEAIKTIDKMDDSQNDATYLSPLPVQKPYPPIWVAAFGPKALRQAGRLGFPYLASPVESLTALEANYAIHKEAQEHSAVGYSAVRPIMRTIFISRESSMLNKVREKLDAETRSRAESPVPAIRESSSSSSDDWAVIGEPTEVEEKLCSYKERLGLTHIIATRTRLSYLTAREAESSLEHLADIVNKN